MVGHCQKGPERSGRNGPLTGRNRKVSTRPATMHRETVMAGHCQEGHGSQEDQGGMGH